jgi:hypothetical protein
MKKSAFLLLMMLFMASFGFAQGQTPPSQPTVTIVLDRQLSNAEREFVPLIEAMPDDKFNYAPTQGEFKGVRNFNEMARHVALTNDQVASAILGQKSTIDPGKNDNGPELKTKAEVVKMVKDSFDKLHKAIATINEKNLVEVIDGPWGGKANRLGMSVLVVSHTFDHYGQLVEYARSNGIVPPASRQ